MTFNLILFFKLGSHTYAGIFSFACTYQVLEYSRELQTVRNMDQCEERQERRKSYSSYAPVELELLFIHV